MKTTETTTQHTPGPWLAGQTITAADPDRAPGSYERITIASRVNNMANARLISAAPELLNSLENILAANPDLAEVADEARAAIAKAKGPTEYDVAAQEAAAWRAKAARDDHPGRGFCLEQAERWEARAIAKAKGGAR